jgi:hypothetical protein
MDVSGSILASLDAGYPCRHDGVCVFILYGERKLMNHFVVKAAFSFTSLPISETKPGQPRYSLDCEWNPGLCAFAAAWLAPGS